jgi:hypothetical protein
MVFFAAILSSITDKSNLNHLRLHPQNDIKSSSYHRIDNGHYKRCCKTLEKFSLLFDRVRAN